jgi:4-hydroxy-tetrahydrodipicolinate synthase
LQWAGVFPAITTPFRPEGSLDLPALAAHVRWLLEARCDAIVALGSLGEGATLTTAEKREVLQTCVRAAGGRAPVVAGVAGLSTAEAVQLARDAEQLGCRGLMVLPPYVYAGDERETLAHFAAVVGATRLPCMLYNNPMAYGVDVTPSQIARLLAEHQNLVAVKDSSGDARRITALRTQCGARVSLFVGLDDMVLEGVAMGAVGWVAGLVNALPRESVRLFELARQGDPQAFGLYAWFLPLLRLDTLPKFVQWIKLVQQEVGRGSETVRPPRLPLVGKERDEGLALIRKTLAAR